MNSRQINLGIMGLGTVGQGLVELVRRNSSLIEQKSSVRINIKRVLVSDRAKERSVDRDLITYEAGDLLDDGDVNCVVELMGGINPAYDYVMKALGNGKHVVTANKALLAAHGRDIFDLASDKGVQVGFEASVCGGIPIIRALNSGLIANRIELLCGIVNSTTNFILSKMTDDGVSFQEALKEAQRAGFAEADPSLDVKGHDAAQKLVILSTIAFGVMLDPERVSVEGIEFIDIEDMKTARELGYEVKLLAVSRRMGGQTDLRVEPSFLPRTHPLANVRNEYNAVLVKGDAIGEMIFYGKGAGSLPTASAVMSDIVDIARNPRSEGVKISRHEFVPSDVESRCYLRFPILDVPGVIGLIATALGNHSVSISHAIATLQRDKKGHGNVKIVTHKARNSVIQRAISEISRLPILTGRPVIFKILDEI